jgi:hypothetical protein
MMIARFAGGFMVAPMLVNFHERSITHFEARAKSSIITITTKVAASLMKFRRR